MGLHVNTSFREKGTSSVRGQRQEQDIRNEVRAIDKLCIHGHINIIAVFLHSRFDDNSPLYYINMELCDLNLG